MSYGRSNWLNVLLGADIIVLAHEGVPGRPFLLPLKILLRLLSKNLYSLGVNSRL